MSSYQDIAHAVALLRQGRPVAFPTETVYGLGAAAFDPAAVARIYELKGRPAFNPLIVHVSGPEMARRVVRAWPEEAELLARAFWPGPLSLVLPRSPDLPGIVTAGADTVAVRCPDHPVALALLFEFGAPLVGPSANPSGMVSPTAAEHVRESFDPDDVFVLEGGPCRAGIESTVLSLVGPPTILRPGLIGADEAAFTIGRPVALARNGKDAGRMPREAAALPSPGLLPRHYAPRTPARLFGPEDWPRVLPGADAPTVVLSMHNRPIKPPHTILLLPRQAEPYAAAIYSALRRADALSPALILIERPPTDGPVWEAIADRLARATSG